ncbi:uncharacterized protein LOC129597007 isoform X2 [Paramacrobiotus metropolitanus]|uniref:uncharacterized protein LOC129597007 isoform X2 n=1 Tax=Paramacrobiotus metropolitanus TaxID=2943436 RepID=UPI00244573BE|nr:uncharacterized protein LOC129597007 isoform X2 [Paramacrobiotus metropolitanus]
MVQQKWTALLVCLTVILGCPRAHSCPVQKPTPPWEMEPYKDRINECLMWHYVEQRPAPNYYNQYMLTFWKKSPRYPVQLLCLVNALTDDRLPSSKVEMYVAEGDPVHLPCRPLENVQRSIPIDSDYYSLGPKGLYYWTKDGRHFCERWGWADRSYKCHGAAEHSSPEGELWIKSFTTADAGVYACAFLHKGSSGNLLRVGQAYLLRDARTKVTVPDIPAPAIIAAPESIPPPSHAEVPSVSSANVITPPTALLPTQWFATVLTNAAPEGLQAKASAMISSAALSNASSEIFAELDENDYSDVTDEILELSPSSAAVVNRRTTPTPAVLVTGLSALPTNSSPWEMEAVSIAHTTDVAYAESTSLAEAEANTNGLPPYTAPPPDSSTQVVEEEKVSTADVNDTEYDADYDHAPGDQRRASSFPPECPPCTGNCPCPLFKRKRKHL